MRVDDVANSICQSVDAGLFLGDGMVGMEDETPAGEAGGLGFRV